MAPLILVPQGDFQGVRSYSLLLPLEVVHVELTAVPSLAATSSDDRARDGHVPGVLVRHGVPFFIGGGIQSDDCAVVTQVQVFRVKHGVRSTPTVNDLLRRSGRVSWESKAEPTHGERITECDRLSIRFVVRVPGPLVFGGLPLLTHDSRRDGIGAFETLERRHSGHVPGSMTFSARDRPRAGSGYAYRVADPLGQLGLRFPKRDAFGKLGTGVEPQFVSDAHQPVLCLVEVLLSVKRLVRQEGQGVIQDGGETLDDFQARRDHGRVQSGHKSIGNVDRPHGKE